MQMILMRFNSSGEVLWQKTYGGDRTTYGRSVAVMASGYILVGYTTPVGSTTKDVFVVKTNKTGEVIKENLYSWEPTSVDLGIDIAVASDGGCVIGARTFPANFAPGDFFAIKTDPDGSM